MSLAVLGGAVLLLLLLIVRCKLNAFLALLLTSFAVALLNGFSATAALQSVLKGIGDTMGSLALILVFGAALGKRIEESGAAHSISMALTQLFGERRIQLSVLVTGFLVGLPMIYNASFLVLIPLIYTLSGRTGLPLMYLGIPLSAALSVTHGYLPPHPAPASIAVLYRADVNLTLLYGLILSIPATILAGPMLARFFRGLRNSPPPEFYEPREFRQEELPGLAVSLFTVLVPVLLMLAGAVVTLAGWNGPFAETIRFLSDPTVALLMAVLLSFYTLGLRRGQGMEPLMQSVGTAAASVSMVLLIIAAGGAFKQVLLDSGTTEAIKRLATGLPVSPLVLAWSTAALLRAAIGSATVAAITAAGIVVPLVPGSSVAPELLVLATTAGSLMFSHFNDIGFWMFKQYYNVSVRETFLIWTVMESIVAVVGLLGTLALAHFTGATAQRAFYVNSYHRGYASSDAVEAALREKLAVQGIALEVFYLDAKRDPAGLPRKAREAVSAIRRVKPRVILASDDDAVQRVVAPHFRDGPIPIVFCGVNWDSSQYGLPSPWVTGMVEVVPVEEALRVVKESLPRVRRLTVLSENSISERNNTRILEPRYRALGLEPRFRLVEDFEEWKSAYLQEQERADVLYLPTNGAIRGWNAAAARDWAKRHARTPAFTCDDFMVPYVAFGLTKVAREQGEWAATAALAILNGQSPSQIPLAANQRTECWINEDQYSRSGLHLPSSLGCKPR